MDSRNQVWKWVWISEGTSWYRKNYIFRSEIGSHTHTKNSEEYPLGGEEATSIGHGLKTNLHVPIYRSDYGELSPCRHLALTDTPIIRTAAKSPTKINYRCLTEINSRYYGLSLLRTLTRGPEGVRNIKRELIVLGQFTRYNLSADFFFCRFSAGWTLVQFKKSVALLQIFINRPIFVRSLIFFVKLGQIGHINLWWSYTYWTKFFQAYPQGTVS